MIRAEPHARALFKSRLSGPGCQAGGDMIESKALSCCSLLKSLAATVKAT
jgi:hypothetical protein